MASVSFLFLREGKRAEVRHKWSKPLTVALL